MSLSRVSMPRVVFTALSVAGVCVVALTAADATTWRDKPIQQWTEADAKQVLDNSPWVKWSPVQIAPPESEDQRRQSGRMGAAGQGVGPTGMLIGVDADGATNRRASRKGKLEIRWESAAPVHAAELKVQDADTPDWKGEYYAIAVYGVPIPADELLENSVNNIKKVSFLKRDGKKDLKPARVEVVAQTDTASTVIYLFPRDVAGGNPISTEDAQVQFTARLGRLLLSQVFNLAEMRFHDKLEI